MENSAGIQASLPGRYAIALFDLASEEGVVSAVESDLEKLSAALSDSDDFGALVASPQISRNDAGKAIDGVAGALGLSDLTKKFLGTLAANRRLGALSNMIRAFQTIAASQRGEVTADVTTAHPLSDDQLAKLKDKLTARQGRTVKINTNVDPDILGGLVVTLGSEQIDSSIRTRLNSLATAMKG